MEDKYFWNKGKMKKMMKKIHLMNNHKYYKFSLKEENKINNNRISVFIKMKLLKEIAQF